MFGTYFAEPSSCWTKPTHVENIDLVNVHGQIFMLASDDRLVAYKYRKGPLTDMANIDPAFFNDLVEYLRANNLATLLGLQILQASSKLMVEFVLHDTCIVMLFESDTSYGNWEDLSHHEMVCW